MQMLEFTQQAAQLVHCNLRVERHGDEKVVAVDLKVEVEVTNDVLDKIDPLLKGSLFRKPNKSDDPDLFDGKGPEGGEVPLRKLKFPKMGPLDWEVKYTGYTLTIHRAVDGVPALFFDVPKIKRLSITPKDGGSVLIGIKLLSVKPGGHLDELSEMVQSGIEITLLPPKEGEQLGGDAQP